MDINLAGTVVGVEIWRMLPGYATERLRFARSSRVGVLPK